MTEEEEKQPKGRHYSSYLTSNLIKACKENRRLEAVKHFTHTPSRIDINCCEDEGSALYWACSRGNLQVVKFLLEEFADRIDVNSEVNSHHSTPLTEAASKGNYDVMWELLKHKDIDINKPGRWGNTPFRNLCWRQRLLDDGQMELVKHLLKRPDFASLNTRCKFNLSAIYETCRVDSASPLLETILDLVPLTTKIEDLEPVFHVACRNGAIKIVKIILECGRPININVLLTGHSLDSGISTPLHEASEFNHPDVVKLLLERKELNVDAPDSKGRQAITYAYYKRYFGVVRLLIKESFVTGIVVADGPPRTAARYRLDWLKRIVTLLSVRQVPRLGRMSALRLLPVEIIRAIGQKLQREWEKEEHVTF